MEQFVAFKLVKIMRIGVSKSPGSWKLYKTRFPYLSAFIQKILSFLVQ